MSAILTTISKTEMENVKISTDLENKTVIKSLPVISCTKINIDRHPYKDAFKKQIKDNNCLLISIIHLSDF